MRGEAEIEVDGHRVGTVGEGGVIGEIALVRDSPRTATVRAATSLDVATFSRHTFHAMVEHFPGVRQAMQELTQRHLEADQQRDGSRTVPNQVQPPG